MRHFEPEEANRLLPHVRRLAEEMVALRRDVLQRRETLEGLRSTVRGNGGGIDAGRAEGLEHELSAAGARLARCVEELTSLGVQVKDLDRGLVDFPARHPADGSTVLLCWQLGELEVGHWHGLEEGFAGRKPLPF